MLPSFPADSHEGVQKCYTSLGGCLLQGVNKTVVNQKTLDFYQLENVGNGLKRETDVPILAQLNDSHLKALMEKCHFNSRHCIAY